MTDERFLELLEGPLNHPLLPFCLTRISLALVMVANSCGREGADALEAYCETSRPECRDADGRMSNDRINELLNGPLRGSDLLATLEKTSKALRYVVDTCGKRGDLALESYCEERDARDRAPEE